MFIRKILLCTALLGILSCTTLPDISRTFEQNRGPWLTLKGDPSTSICINWLSAENVRTELLWGEEPDDLKLIQSSASPSRKHNLYLDDLKPDTRYFYSNDGEIYSYTTAPRDDSDYRITVVGDLQPFKAETQGYNRLMAETLREKGGDLIVQLGDVTENGGNNAFWDLTLSNVIRYASERPFQAAAGNHDYYWNGQENFRRIFPYDYPSEDELYHSSRYRNSMLIFLDVHTENLILSSEQLDWLEGELIKAQKEHRWTFVFFHQTLMSTGDGWLDMELMGDLVPLFDTYGVHAVFFAHTHIYEHWLYPYGQSGFLFNRDDQPREFPVHYFLSGGGGGSINKENLTEREDRWLKTQWFDRESGEPLAIEAQSRAWNRERYLDPINQEKRFYHLPEEESYSYFNRLFGFTYGEKTLHYIDLEFSGEENQTCTISVRDSDGGLLSGPDNLYPQQWTIKKGETN